LTAAWAIFRRWGTAGGLLAVVALAVVMWSKGAASLVQPISSNIGWLPLLCTSVLVWGLLCRDWRLLTAAVLFGSFTAQQHLAVVPAAVMVVAWAAVAVALALVAWRRRGSPRPGDQDLARSCRWALAVGALCWLPAVLDTFFDFPGNTLRIARYAVEGGGGSSYGPGGGVRQVLNAIGFPPLLTRTELDGLWLVRSVDAATAITAVLVIGALAGLAYAWRRSDPTFTRLVILGGGVMAGGFLTGMTQPDADSANRIAYYHWAFTLGFVELLAVGWVVWSLVRRWWLADRPVPRGARMAAVPVAALLVLVSGIAESTVDRSDRDLPNFVAPATIDRLVDVVRSHRDELGSSFVVLRVGDEGHLQLGDTLAQQARKAGLPATFSPDAEGYVAERHTMDPCTNERAVVLGIGVDEPRSMPGRVVDRVGLYPDFDLDTYLRLVDSAKGREVVLGPALEARLASEASQQRRADTLALQAFLGRRPGALLRSRHHLALLSEAPPASPALDQEDLRSLLRGFPDDLTVLEPTMVSVSILDRDQIRDRWPGYALDC
jgi:hypothetical protein